MGVYAPEDRLTETERNLLYLLARLILETPDSGRAANLAAETVPLSQSDALALLGLLEQYASTARFRSRAEFVEKLGGAEYSPLFNAREIYLSGRTQAGRTRVAASWQWADFLQRLGKGGEPPPGRRKSPMSFAHFLNMEDRLFSELDLHPRVRALLLQFIVDRRRDTEDIRFGRKKIRRGGVLEIPQTLKESAALNGHDPGCTGLPLRKVVALTTLTADLSVMFTTRDWGVAGTLSAIAAVTPNFLTK